jgi:cytochrome o ubiquinol oxidase subunit 2
MNKKYRLVLLLVLLVAFGGLAWHYLSTTNIAVLNPKGPIADKQRNLIYFTLGLVSIVVIPVYALALAFAWRYREGNKKAKYSPNLDGSRIAETFWWLIPGAIILVLSVVTWRSSHQLDPSVPIASSKPPLTVQVIAMDWKWLFIYPQQNVASVNLLQIPVGTPVDFEITSDAPMNSFWIPQLGGQIYAMAGMSTQLHLEATSPGSYYGSSANISGRGFAGMNFIARASSNKNFSRWVQTARSSADVLSLERYNQLARPSQNNPVALFSATDPGLYGDVLNRFMLPGGEVSVQ